SRPRSGRLAELANDVAQHRLAHRARGLGARKPFDRALALFRPGLALAGHPGRKNLHVAENRLPFFHKLLLRRRADRPLADLTDNTGLFERLARGCSVRRLALHRPALGNDPAPGAARRHQHHLRPGVAVAPKRQRRVLHATGLGFSARTSYWLPNGSLWASMPLQRMDFLGVVEI